MGAAGPRIPVLLVHGIRTSASMWRHQREWLAAAGHPVLAVDLPGHGSRLHEPFTLEGALAAIDAGVDRLGAPVLLVGLSLGGYYAIAYAARNPGKVLGLVAAGRSNRQIGQDLFLSEATVKSHLVHIFGKLGVGSRTSAVASARASGTIRGV